MINSLTGLLENIAESLEALREISKHLEVIEEQMKKYDELEDEIDMLKARLSVVESRPAGNDYYNDWWKRVTVSGPTAL